jgi:hypothetical protein
MRSLVSCVLIISALLLGQTGTAQNEPSRKLSFGFNLGQYQQDFGLGLNLTSPYFLQDRMAVRLRANLMFHEHIENFETTWTPYTNFTLGLIGVGGTIGNFARLYGEGGAILLLPNEAFSSASAEFGGYGLFGFEFFMNPHINYFIELGGVGTGAEADQILFDPLYSNGFLIQTGFRIYL